MFAAQNSQPLVEPGGAAALAALLAGKLDVRGKTVALVVSGGNAEFAQVAGMLARRPRLGVWWKPSYHQFGHALPAFGVGALRGRRIAPETPPMLMPFLRDATPSPHHGRVISPDLDGHGLGVDAVFFERPLKIVQEFSRVIGAAGPIHHAEGDKSPPAEPFGGVRLNSCGQGRLPDAGVRMGALRGLRHCRRAG